MFKTFPEFSKLTLEDKREYERLIKDYPPISDIAFPSVLAWWEDVNNAKVALLSGNLVLPYWLAGDENITGLSLIGTQNIDESLCIIFDYQKQRRERPRVVNVPEFVIANIQHPNMFTCKEQRNYHEYLVDPANFYPLANMRSIWRKRAEKRLKAINGQRIYTTPINLNTDANRFLLLEQLDKWQSRNINNYGNLEREATSFLIAHAQNLDIKAVGMYVEDHLYGYCIYHKPVRDTAVVYSLKATHKKELGYELLSYLLAKYLVEDNVTTVNLNADYGLLGLRMFMLTLGPTNFFRKYSIDPV